MFEQFIKTLSTYLKEDEKMRIIHIGGTVDQHINSDHIVRVTPLYMDQTKEEKYYHVVLLKDSIQVYEKRDMSRDSFISKWKQAQHG